MNITPAEPWPLGAPQVGTPAAPRTAGARRAERPLIVIVSDSMISRALFSQMLFLLQTKHERKVVFFDQLFKIVRYLMIFVVLCLDVPGPGRPKTALGNFLF